MSLRGRVVAVVEMAPLLGLPGRAQGDGGGQVLVLDRERRALGFLVDEVLGVEPLGPLERPGDGLPVKGLSTVRGSPVAVLDPDARAAAAKRLFGGRAG
jgi:purine-binding chemotaxis protein CheW